MPNTSKEPSFLITEKDKKSPSCREDTVKEGILPRLTRELDIIFNQSIHSCEDPTIMNLNTSTWPWFTPCYATSTWLLHFVIIFSQFQTSLYTFKIYTLTLLHAIGFEFIVSTPWRLPWFLVWDRTPPFYALIKEKNKAVSHFT